MGIEVGWEIDWAPIAQPQPRSTWASPLMPRFLNPALDWYQNFNPHMCFSYLPYVKFSRGEIVLPNGENTFVLDFSRSFSRKFWKNVCQSQLRAHETLCQVDVSTPKAEKIPPWFRKMRLQEACTLQREGHIDLLGLFIGLANIFCEKARFDEFKDSKPSAHF